MVDRQVPRGILRTISIPAGTSTIDLLAAIPDELMEITGGTLLIEGVGDVQLVEETSGAILSGIRRIPTGAIGAEWNLNDGIGKYATAAVNKGLQISRSASIAITGELIFQRWKP